MDRDFILGIIGDPWFLAGVVLAIYFVLTIDIAQNEECDDCLLYRGPKSMRGILLFTAIWPYYLIKWRWQGRK